MLVMTRPEWIERGRRLTFKMFYRMGLMFIVMYLCILVLVGLLWFGDPSVRLLLLIISIILGTTFLATWIFAFLMTLRGTGKDPVSGLYERGVQMNELIFVPYEEIASLEVKQRVLGPGRESVVNLKMRYKPKGLAWFTTPTMFIIKGEFLTEEGIVELGGRVRGEPREQSPPKLVLYGPRR